MGDRITTFNDCPKCGGKGTFECYEALSSLMKFDECVKCGYSISYDVDDTDDVITITRKDATSKDGNNPRPSNTRTTAKTEDKPNPENELEQMIEQTPLYKEMADTLWQYRDAGKIQVDAAYSVAEKAFNKGLEAALKYSYKELRGVSAFKGQLGGKTDEQHIKEDMEKLRRRDERLY